MFAAAIRLFPALFATFSLIMALAPMGRADAADVSAWDGDARSAVRLIAARTAAAPLRAGVEIRLASGWKTYWRYPGDSGVPPRFDFSESDNAKVTLRWPAPQLFSDSDGNTIGYHDDVIFPLQVEAQNPNAPVTLRLKLDYAVCEKLCVPAEAKAELALSDASNANEAALADAESRVPRPSQIGAAGALSIVSVRREGGTSPPRVLVDVLAPTSAKLALFAEGPTPDWALPVPKATSGAPAGQQRFVFVLDGLPSESKPEGAMLRLTAVATDAAIEATYRLD